MTSSLTDFIDSPGRAGPFGALVDETARAADEFCRIVEDLSPEAYVEARTSADPDTVSVRAICAHAVGAARRYADYIRKARGLPHVDRYVQDEAGVATPADVRPRLCEALRYTEGALDGLYEAGAEAIAALRFEVCWGPVYDPEMILEHGVCHLLRHRRQVERWTRAGASRPG